MVAVNSSWALSNNSAGYYIINGYVDGTYDSNKRCFFAKHEHSNDQTDLQSKKRGHLKYIKVCACAMKQK